MKKFVSALVVGCTILLTAWPQQAWATNHYGKMVGQIFGPDTRDCFFFTLVGVTEADPVNPGSAWFAIPRAHLGFREVVAIIMSQRLAGQPINVYTTGSLACGHAEVLSVFTD